MLCVDQRNSDGGGFFVPWKNKRPREHLRQLFNLLFSFPDKKVGWFPFALARGMRAIRKNNISILVTCGPPHLVHLIGACLNNLTRIPWIVDFRDPCLDSVINGQAQVEDDLCRKLDRKLEAFFLSQAAFILTTTERHTALLQSRYPVREQNIFTLLNGYDPDDFARVHRRKKSALQSLSWEHSTTIATLSQSYMLSRN